MIVTNNGPVPLTITELNDDIYGDIGTDSNPDIENNTCDELIGDVLQPGQSSSPCSFVGEFEGDSGDSQTDTVTVTGVDDAGTEVTDDDAATVTLTTTNDNDDDLNIGVVKTANPTTRPAPGGDFTFTVVVSNDGDVRLEITELRDNVYGDLGDSNNSNISNNTCDDLIGDFLDPGEDATCSFTGRFTGSGGASQTDIVTVTGEDENGREDEDDDDATVTLTPSGSPSIQVDKTANPETRPAPGGDFTFTVRVTNNSSVPITILSLNDNIYGNLGDSNNSRVTNNTCDDLINDELQPGQSATCSFTGAFSGSSGQSQTDIVRVEGRDRDNNRVTDDDDARVDTDRTDAHAPSGPATFARGGREPKHHDLQLDFGRSGVPGADTPTSSGRSAGQAGPYRIQLAAPAGRGEPAADARLGPAERGNTAGGCSGFGRTAQDPPAVRPHGACSKAAQIAQEALTS